MAAALRFVDTLEKLTCAKCSIPKASIHFYRGHRRCKLCCRNAVIGRPIPKDLDGAEWAPRKSGDAGLSVLQMTKRKRRVA